MTQKSTVVFDDLLDVKENILFGFHTFPKHLFGFEVPSDECFLFGILLNLLGSRMRPRWLGYVYYSGQTNVKTGDSCYVFQNIVVNLFQPRSHGFCFVDQKSE